MATGWRWLSRFCILLCAMNSAAAASWQPDRFDPLRTLHVSTFGSDDNDGRSADRPFRTISKAAATVKPGDLVLVRGGVYVEHVHLETPGTASRAWRSLGPSTWRSMASSSAIARAPGSVCATART